jgi:hypothetical protein
VDVQVIFIHTILILAFSTIVVMFALVEIVMIIAVHAINVLAAMSKEVIKYKMFSM